MRGAPLPPSAGGPHTVAIIGVGSPFGDDTLGWRAIDLLEQGGLRSCVLQGRLRFRRYDRPGALLLDELRGVDAALIIDAMRSGAPAGTLRKFRADELTPESGLLSTHGFGVAEALALTLALAAAPGAAPGRGRGVPEQLAVIGIEMADSAGSEELPPSWQAPLLALARQTLAAWATP